jgi:hypothetical protein
MKHDVILLPLRLVRYLLLLCCCLFPFSSASFARPLKVGDEYAGGIVIYLYQPGEEGFKESARETVIAGKTNISENLYWSDAKAASDKFDGSSYRDLDLPARLSARSIAVVDAIKNKSMYR